MIRRLTFEKILATPDANGMSQTSSDYIADFRTRRDRIKQMIARFDEATTDTAQPDPKSATHKEQNSEDLLANPGN